MIDALVIEDHVDIQELLVDQLEDKGCQVQSASNGSAGLRRIKNRKPDIIFVDIIMPVMDGIGFISELQENPETFEIPIVVVTAINLPEVKTRAAELGVSLVLAKPWSL